MDIEHGSGLRSLISFDGPGGLHANYIHPAILGNSRLTTILLVVQEIIVVTLSAGG